MGQINTAFHHARVARGLSLQAVAGVKNASALNRFETGKTTLGTQRMLALMESLGLNFLDVRGSAGIFLPPWQFTYEAMLTAQRRVQPSHAAALGAAYLTAPTEVPAPLADMLRCLILATTGEPLTASQQARVATHLVEMTEWFYLEFQLVQQVVPQLDDVRTERVLQALLAVATPARLHDPHYLYRAEYFKALVVILRHVVLSGNERLWQLAWPQLAAIQMNASANMALIWQKKVLQAGHTSVQQGQPTAALTQLLRLPAEIGAPALAQEWQAWATQIGGADGTGQVE
ncbi:helix-turn-helix domain-containing protein [Lacticaseibacillus daqingensis]|uniref:helix-turn-helix domain-containing protein n=1 Tax=Lacticaseibacillus daqingensis TaxID=2486014 RepID=UPI000F7746DF|nr:helix-turn-helix transcriptional regulator [Lacticaseibacillus daqingensis]